MTSSDKILKCFKKKKEIWKIIIDPELIYFGNETSKKYIHISSCDDLFQIIFIRMFTEYVQKTWDQWQNLVPIYFFL